MKRIVLALIAVAALSTSAQAGGWYLMQPTTQAPALWRLGEWWRTFRGYPASPIGTQCMVETIDFTASTDAPISQWRQVGVFASLAECDARRTEDSQYANELQEDIYRLDNHQAPLHRTPLQWSGRSAGEPRDCAQLDALMDSTEKCVPSDDPRLAR